MTVTYQKFRQGSVQLWLGGVRPLQTRVLSSLVCWQKRVDVKLGQCLKVHFVGQSDAEVVFVFDVDNDACNIFNRDAVLASCVVVDNIESNSTRGKSMNSGSSTKKLMPLAKENGEKAVREGSAIPNLPVCSSTTTVIEISPTKNRYRRQRIECQHLT